jgi:hypothetical protein
MDKGAQVIYAINVGPGVAVQPSAQGVLSILSRTMKLLVVQSLLVDLDRASANPAIELHHVHITAFEGLAFDDFDHIDEMVAAGEAATDDYLAHPQPRLVARQGENAGPGRTIVGAREILPPYGR